MQRNTKIFIGLGLAAVAAYFVFKPKKSSVVSGGTTGGSTPPAQKTCPDGQRLTQVQCAKAPCPAMCMEIEVASGKPAPFIEKAEYSVDQIEFGKPPIPDYPVVDYYSKPILCNDGTYDYWKLGGKPCQSNGGINLRSEMQNEQERMQSIFGQDFKPVYLV